MTKKKEEIPEFQPDGPVIALKSSEDEGEFDGTKNIVKILGKEEDSYFLECCSCLNKLAGTNSHVNFNEVKHRGQLVLLCNDCNQKFKNFPQITPAFYVKRNDEGKLFKFRFSDLQEE